MSHQPPSRKPTLEDLIRIKRAERPPAEFWQRFEQELRAKQLAAIVEPRPWWQSLARIFPGRRGALAGLGAAAAALVVAYVQVPSSQSTVVSRVPTVGRELSGMAPPPVAVVVSPAPVSGPAATVSVPTEAALPAGASMTISEEPPRETLAASNIMNPEQVAVKFSEVRVPPPRSAMELALPATTLGFATAAKSIAGSAEPLAAIPSPGEQIKARFASVAELAMLTVPMPASSRSRTPSDADLKDRELGRVLARGNALGFNF